jgi:hypothetical protein
MTDLETFFQHNVEGYLFGDLREMQRVPIGYPLLMTTFAGIELLGALLSTSRFNTYDGSVYFTLYWKTHLYPGLNDTEAIGNVLYQLVRHGIAHGFVLKGPMAVFCSEPGVHLTRDSSGLIRVDAVQLATDLMDSFTAQVKPLVTSTAGVDGTSMVARLREMETDYLAQAAKLPVASVFPLSTVATTANVSHSIASNSGPANRGQTGPSGPTFGSKLPGSIP